MKRKTIFAAALMGFLILGNTFAFSETPQGSKPVANKNKADKAKPTPSQITTVPPGTGKSSCSARSEDGKISCSKSCKEGETANCNSTETEATCVCE